MILAHSGATPMLSVGGERRFVEARASTEFATTLLGSIL